MRNRDVVRAWREGRAASGGHIHTDGCKLWSYALIIGNTLMHGTQYAKKVAYDYTAPKHFASMTTSCHVGLAKQVADLVTEPSPYWHRSG